MTGPAKETLDRLRAIVGPAGSTSGPDDLAPHLREWRGRYQGATPLLLKPGSTNEVAKIVKVCAETKTAIVPQGGNTGLVGAQIPFGEEVLVSLQRMRTIREVDAENAAITVEAGCPLAAAQDAAKAHGLLLATSLASEGTATIGGIVSTNAGGTNVLRYGMTREQVLGLEVVLPSGDIWHGLTGLRKDNTGYDLKQLFIGAEGTLGVVTAATFKLFSRPAHTATMLCALPDVNAAVTLLHLARDRSGGQVSTFEFFARRGLEFVTAHVPAARDPFGAAHPWYVLLEIDGSDAGILTRDAEALLAAASERGLLEDAVLAQSDAQAEELWVLRERLSEVQKAEGGSIKHDVAVPISAVPAFLAEATGAVEAACPGIRPVPFGHLGDGNIHFNLSQPEDADRDAFLARWDEISRIVHDIVAKYGGSISAEHGLGVMKREEILRYKPAVEMEMMKGIKRALDPLGIMNPGKVIGP
jgi:FAD/FMN-containing dehydrogenase